MRVPLVVEPMLTVRQQVWLWSGGYVVFAILLAVLAWGTRGAPVGAAEEGRAEFDCWICLALQGPGWTQYSKAVFTLLFVTFFSVTKLSTEAEL